MSRTSRLRTTAYLFYIGLYGINVCTASYYLINTTLSHRNLNLGTFALIAWPMVGILFVTHLIQIIKKFRNWDLTLGTFDFLISCYMTLALLDDFFDWRKGEDLYDSPRFYFTAWSAFIIIMAVMAFIMIYVDGKVKRNKAENLTLQA